MSEGKKLEESKTPKSVDTKTQAEKDLYKKVFDDVCKKLGTTPAKLDQIAAVKAKQQEMMEYEIPFNCKINGKVYPKKGIATKGEVQMLRYMASSKRMRLIREKVGNEYEVIQMVTGQISSRKIRSRDEAGIEVGTA